MPLICGVSVFTMVSNYLMTRYHRPIPIITLGGIIAALGGILVYALNNTTSTTSWVFLELVVAVGVGLVLQLPMVANQAAVVASDIPVVTSMTLFFETMGQALFTAAGEAALLRRLVTELQAHAKQVDPQEVINAGATGFRKLFDAQQVEVIVKCYQTALKANHAVSMACGILAMAISVAMFWPEVKRRWSRV